jgi:hypothetical protein
MNTTYTTLLLVALLAIPSVATAFSPTDDASTTTSYTLQGSGVSAGWTWIDLGALPEESHDIVFYQFKITCWGERDCEGEAHFTGSLGGASCYIDRGDSWYHGTIRVGTRLATCHDVPTLRVQNILPWTDTHDLRVTGPPGTGLAGIGSGVGTRAL